MDVSIIEAFAVLKCSSCGRGELIPQSKPQEIFSYRARVSQAIEAEKSKWFCSEPRRR